MQILEAVGTAHRVMEPLAVKLEALGLRAISLDGVGNSRTGFGYLNDGEEKKKRCRP